MQREQPRATVDLGLDPLERASLWSDATFAAYRRGLLATELLEDLRDGSRFTLLAPTTQAFRTLPWRLDQFLESPRWLEERFDFFEYSVLRGHHAGSSRRQAHRTLHGHSVVLSAGLVHGRIGSARILRSLIVGRLLIHVTDALVYPLAVAATVLGPPRYELHRDDSA